MLAISRRRTVLRNFPLSRPTSLIPYYYRKRSERTSERSRASARERRYLQLQRDDERDSPVQYRVRHLLRHEHERLLDLHHPERDAGQKHVIREWIVYEARALSEGESASC